MYLVTTATNFQVQVKLVIHHRRQTETHDEMLNILDEEVFHFGSLWKHIRIIHLLSLWNDVHEQSHSLQLYISFCVHVTKKNACMYLTVWICKRKTKVKKKETQKKNTKSFATVDMFCVGVKTFCGQRIFCITTTILWDHSNLCRNIFKLRFHKVWNTKAVLVTRGF